MKPKEIKNRRYWAYFCPNGHVQSRSIQLTKGLSRTFISSGIHNQVTFKDYENAGYVLKRILLNIEILN